MLLKPHSWQNKLKSLPLRKNNAKHLRKPNTRDVELKKRSAKKRKKRLWLQLLTMLSARRLLKSRIESAKLTKRRLMNSLERLLRRLRGLRLSRMQS
jgi:phosphatidate phosphatase PAH1